MGVYVIMQRNTNEVNIFQLLLAQKEKCEKKTNNMVNVYSNQTPKVAYVRKFHMK